MQSRRATQKDIALLAKVSRSTVSLVLTNHPSIPPKTRQLVLNAAQKIGYCPDPMLSALAAYRSRQRRASFHGSLAWLYDGIHGAFWKTGSHFEIYYEGAAARAKELGYELEVFDLNEFKGRVNRLISIFHARNITGVLLCPQPNPNTVLELPWERLSAVTFGYSLSAPHLHTVAPAQYLAGHEVLRKLLSMGYRRIGFAVPQVSLERTNYNYLSAYLIHQDTVKESPRIPLLTQHPRSVGTLEKWISKHKIDAIIAEDQRILRELKAIRLKVPQDIGVASPALATAKSGMSGIVENCEEIGTVALDFLVAMINRGERGIPRYPQRLHVEGIWFPGNTLKPPKKKK